MSDLPAQLKRALQSAPEAEYVMVRMSDVREAVAALEALKPVVVDRSVLEEIIATKVMRYECAADVRAVDDNEPEALDAGVNAVLALLYPKAQATDDQQSRMTAEEYYCPPAVIDMED